MTLWQARGLAWYLLQFVEKEEVAEALAALKAKGSSALEAGRWDVLAEHGIVEHLQWCGQFGNGRDDFELALAAFRPYAGDAEVRSRVARLEAGLGLAKGEVLGIPDGEEAGFIYPMMKTREYFPKYGSWEVVQGDSAYPKDVEVIVMRPSGEDVRYPAPVLVWLAGNALVDGRNSPFGGCFAALLTNEEIRRNFYIIHPMPETRSGVVAYTGKGFAWTFNEDAVWSTITQVMQRLGPEKVDPSRLYIAGLSLGAQGTWRMAAKYGKHIAAVIPMAGQCDWPGDSWPRGSGPSEQTLENLRSVAMRAYHTDTDDYAGNPKTDIEWLVYDCYESSFDVQIAGLGCGEPKMVDTDMFRCLVTGDPFPFVKEPVEGGQPTIRRPRPEELKRLNVHVKSWTGGKRAPHSPMELWYIQGKLYELVSNGFPTDHIIHYRILTNPLWGFASFLLEHHVPEERCWRFDSEPFIADGSEHRKYVEECWGQEIFQGEGELPEAQEPSGPSEELWEVQGGEKEGGIIVRKGLALDSPQEPARLATGALVAGLELRGQRLLYELRVGEGPQLGWVSITSSKGKQLMVRSQRQAPLRGDWEIRLGADDPPVVVLSCWQQPSDDSSFKARIRGPANVEASGSFQDGCVDCEISSEFRFKGRLGQDGKTMEDAAIIDKGTLLPASVTWVHELKRFHAPPMIFRMTLASAPPGSEFMVGWTLGSQRHYARDNRNDFSSYAILQRSEGLGKWADQQWEFAPGSRPNCFKITWYYAEGLTDFFLGPRYMRGWVLHAGNDREYCGKDGRDDFSNYLCVQNPLVEAGKNLNEVEWELLPGRTCGAYKLRLYREPNARDWVDGFYLMPMRFMERDMRTERSTYVILQSDTFDGASKVEWEIAPGSAPNLRTIKCVKAGDSVGWYLNAVRQLTSDKKGDDGTFVFVQAQVGKAKVAEWELIPAGREDVYRIRLHSLPIASAGAGWYLGTQCLQWPRDWRNVDSAWVCLQDAGVWPPAAEAEWKLTPTGEENTYRIQLQRMPHRANRTGCWLSAARGIEKDARNDESTYAHADSADVDSAAAAFEWFIQP